MTYGDPYVTRDGPGPGVRDFAGPPSTELPPGCRECRALRDQLHVMQQRDDFQRDYLARVIADLAAATRRLAAIDARNERPTP